MTGPFATRFFRVVFILAGCYNLAFGVWAGFWPLQFFEIFNIAPPHYPAIWSCLGMVVGVYGLLYWYAAWMPDRARPIIAIGLLGKVLGPIGMACSISEMWPARLAMLNVCNDVIWWLPFALFLLRGSRFAHWGASLPPWLFAAATALAYVAMGLWLRHGLLPADNVSQRAAYIAQHSACWFCGWVMLMLADFGSITFYAWWAAHLHRQRLATLAILLAAAGFICDISGESVYALLLTDRCLPTLADPAQFAAASFVACDQAATLLTAGAANFLYTVCGLLLLLITPGLPRFIRLVMWLTWLAGFTMTFAACLNWTGGIVVSNIVLFPLLILWTIWMACRWRPA